MNPKRPRRRCLCCREWFHPDPRSRFRQQFCSKPACRKARKTLAHQRWAARPENQDHWRGESEVERVRLWRLKHPGYWKGTRRRPVDALQDEILPKDPLLVGILSELCGSTLQDDIASEYARLLAKGREILSQ